ncbi:MAG: hypothetical protein M3Q97_11910, partial [Bacteroidota bacterium]|nr:hypothetical protein [Bacteroidota bacterium]
DSLTGLPAIDSTLKKVKNTSLYWIFEAFFKASEIIRHHRIDMIYSRVMPPYGHLPALLLSYRFHLPWVANWSDPTPLAISPAPYTGPFKRKDKIIFGLLKNVAKRASWHTFPSKHLAEYMLEFYPEIKGRYSIVPHIAFSKLFTQPEYDQDVFKICHVGGLEQREPANFINAVAQFMHSHSSRDVKILFIGPVDEEAKSLVGSLGLEKIFSFIPSVSYERSLEYMAACEVSLVIEADMKKGIFLPSKVMDIIQLGKPMLAVSPGNGVMNDLLSLKGGGIAVDRNNVEEIVASLDSLYTAWSKKELDSIYGSSVLREEFNEATVIQNFCAIKDMLN